MKFDRTELLNPAIKQLLINKLPESVQATTTFGYRVPLGQLFYYVPVAIQVTKEQIPDGLPIDAIRRAFTVKPIEPYDTVLKVNTLGVFIEFYLRIPTDFDPTGHVELYEHTNHQLADASYTGPVEHKSLGTFESPMAARTYLDHRFDPDKTEFYNLDKNEGCSPFHTSTWLEGQRVIYSLDTDEQNPMTWYTYHKVDIHKNGVTRTN